MNVAYVTTFDARDIRRGSGTFTYLGREMERQGHTVHYIGPLDYDVPLAAQLLQGAHRRLGRRHALFLDPLVGRRLGAQVARRLANVDHDILFTNDVAVAAFTPSERPIILYTDVMITPDYAERHLPGARLANLSPLALWLCRRTIRRALDRANLLVFPAQWVADAALAYGVDPARLRLIPFGANVDDPGPAVAHGRRLDPNRFDLLFVGKDWERKGGNIAVETAVELRRRGVSATLHCVGATPPVANPAVHVHGLLDKSDPVQRDRLNALYRDCDAFILPSRSEGFVIVLLEAAAFGLPALAYASPGVADAVRDGETGRLLPPGAPPAAFADAVAAWRADPAAYRRTAVCARAHYESSVNWPRAVATLFEEMGPLVGSVAA